MPLDRGEFALYLNASNHSSSWAENASLADMAFSWLAPDGVPFSREKRQAAAAISGLLAIFFLAFCVLLFCNDQLVDDDSEFPPMTISQQALQKMMEQDACLDDSYTDYILETEIARKRRELTV